ncbi:MAG: MarR family transcriptional regulator [Myxococcota bacterium]|nr:MarR family transcriptional regulator [Myxococcota bacterium]
MDEPELEDRIVASIRRIVRAIDLHSRRLVEQHGLTAPQLATLDAARRLDAPTVGSLARAVHLSQPTISGIVDRLERQGLVRRERLAADRRAVAVRVTAEGEKALALAPSLLQDTFRRNLSRLAEWEQHGLLAALQRIAAMMDAEALDASPYLETGPVLPADSGADEPSGDD